ncbi:MAG: HDOD domain-containing protein [Paludibacterium sp.]|uniref:HDOD domain-containing protein n=1 Tax=Paludibacterium sp. TaxID=1917523 RepID=UPI0025CDA330|nr:HDOD domain-containing protein [Paludibacterium sp.]MBV8046814.1 HDOD domain-containing protein [Paludibacterium sp.]MBV8649336.1 HDOD domain-containing protein [Paludibacterium sp.]
MQVAEVFEKASGKLPMIPKVVQQLVHSLNNADSVNNEEIARTVGHDQVLTARVLRLANTARFGGSRRVGSLDDALIILGFDTLRVLVIASGITGTTASIPQFDLKSFWKNSFEIANTAKTLAERAHQLPQLAFACGLLARIGELVLHLAAPGVTPEIERKIGDSANRIDIERALLGVDSAQVGAELAWRWSFPEEIVTAIGQQYPLDGKEGKPPLATLIGLSRQIVRDFNLDLDPEVVFSHLPPLALTQLGLSGEQLLAMADSLKDASTTVDELF